jgi:hypothetical protein
MGYGFLVFEVSEKHRQKASFDSWISGRFSRETEPDCYKLETASIQLQSWLREYWQVFPPLNGPHAIDEEHLLWDQVTEYTIETDMVHIDVAFSDAKRALMLAQDLAGFYGLGICDTSDLKVPVWLPSAEGRLRLVHVNK